MARFNFSGVPEVAPTGAPGNDYESIPAATPAAFGGLIGAATEKLGQGVESVGNAGLGYLQAKQNLTNEISASETNTWLAKNLTDKFNEFGQKQGKAAQDALPQFKQDTEDLYQQSIKNAGGNLQMQAMLAKSGRFLTDAYYRYGTNHADQQWRAWQGKTFDDRATEFGNQAAVAAQHGTWDEVDAFLGTSDDEVRKKLEAQHLDGDSIAAEVAKRRGANVKNIVETLSNNGDPRTAQAIFDKYQDGMDAGSKVAVTSHLKSLNAQLQGRTIADEETGRAPRGGVAPEPVGDIPGSFVGAIKREEGFDAKPRWDVKQWTVGYGTRASGPDERPDHDELEKRFQSEIGKAGKIVDEVNPHLDPGTKAALTSLTYNTGDAWTRAGLGEKIRAGDLAGAKPLFLQYGNVAGAPNAAVSARRWRESQWFGQAEAPAGGAMPDKAQAFDRILARTDGNPLLQNAAIARMNQLYSVERAEQTQGRVLFEQRVKDEKAEVYNTGALATKTPLTENDFVQHDGLERGRQAYAEHQQDVQLGADMQAAAAMGPEDRRALYARYEPQPGPGYAAQAQRQAHFMEAMARLDKERKEDPAGLALKRLPDVRASYQGMAQVEGDKNSNPEAIKAARANFAATMRQEQTRIGIDPQEQRLLPKDAVDRMNQRFAAAADSEDPKARIALVANVRQEAELWGDSWPTVMRQLAPETRPLVRAIAAGADPDAMTRLLRLEKTDTPATILKEQNETTPKKVETAVNDAMAPYQHTLMPVQREKEGKGYSNLAEKLAALHVRDDSDAPEVAAGKAFNELVGNRFTFKDTWRIPKSANVPAEEVQAGTVAARHALADLGAKPPVDDLPGRSADSIATDLALVARNGTWITDKDNSGLNMLYRFVDADGISRQGFVRGADDRPLLVPWAELARRGRAYAQDQETAMAGARELP